MESLKITIYDNNRTKITISCLQDLKLLPDKSITVLFNNTNYIETIYLYVLYKLDMYLDEHNYTGEIRAMYFNDCFSIIPKLIKQQENFLSGKRFSSGRPFDGVPKEITVIHRKCIKDVSSYFSGILSTTPYLDSKVFPKKKLIYIKHNYAYIIQLLRGL